MAEARSLLQKQTRPEFNHHFWPADLRLAQDSGGPLAAVTGHQQITVAYLLALAV